MPITSDFGTAFDVIFVSTFTGPAHLAEGKSRRCLSFGGLRMTESNVRRLITFLQSWLDAGEAH